MPAMVKIDPDEGQGGDGRAAELQQHRRGERALAVGPVAIRAARDRAAAEAPGESGRMGHRGASMMLISACSPG